MVSGIANSVRLIPVTEHLTISRECDGCTKCCEGWLTGVAHGKHFWPGRPCHFVTTNGCAIYKDRPENPCKTYECEWLKDGNIPEWLKPSVSNIIITTRTKDGIGYWSVEEAGSKITVEALSWLLSYCLQKGINIKYSIGSGHYKFGSSNFMALQFT